MPKYLIEVDYTKEGTIGLLQEGGTKRRAAVTKAVKSVGGKLESFYYTFGTRDAVLVAEVPDNITAVALSMIVGASGAVTFKTTPIITCEEMDEAIKKHPAYKAPGE